MTSPLGKAERCAGPQISCPHKRCEKIECIPQLREPVFRLRLHTFSWRSRPLSLRFPRQITWERQNEENLRDSMTEIRKHDLLAFTAQTAPSGPVALPEGLAFRAWAPSLHQPLVPTLGKYGMVLSAYHFLGVFSSRCYGALFIFHENRSVHRSVIIPRYYRYSFMGDNDLQIGATWTDPRFRGTGLATAALQTLVAAHLQPGRKLWYFVSPENKPSIAAATRAGFVQVGRLRKLSPLGLSLLCRYEIQIA